MLNPNSAEIQRFEALINNEQKPFVDANRLNVNAALESLSQKFKLFLKTELDIETTPEFDLLNSPKKLKAAKIIMDLQGIPNICEHVCDLIIKSQNLGKIKKQQKEKLQSFIQLFLDLIQ